MANYVVRDLNPPSYKPTADAMDYILYINNRPDKYIFNKIERLRLLEACRNSKDFICLTDLLCQRVIAGNNIVVLSERIENIYDFSSTELIIDFANTIQSSIFNYGDIYCIYIRNRELDLCAFVKKLAENWQKKFIENPSLNASADIIVSDIFSDVYWKNLVRLNANDDADEISRAVKFFIIEQWSELRWIQTELELHAMDEMDRESLDLKSLLEFIFYL